MINETPKNASLWGGVMEDQRRSTRVECEDNSLLNAKGMHYFGTVCNISSGGALIRCQWHPDVLVGDECDLVVEGGICQEFQCHIVRIDATRVAVKFNQLQPIENEGNRDESE
jgi:hypothetical protein